jgi:hypothetical protein
MAKTGSGLAPPFLWGIHFRQVHWTRCLALSIIIPSL